MYMGEQVVYGNSLHLLLSFTMNHILILKSIVFKTIEQYMK